MTESPRGRGGEDDGVKPRVAPVRSLAALPALQSLGLGLADATGLACYLDDPDCEQPAPLSAAPSTTAEQGET